MPRYEIQVPEKFKLVLSSEDLGLINLTAAKFGKIYDDNRLYFFPEYTNHGITHIEEVLKTSAELISDDSYSLLDSKDITVLILSVVLHDLGMHISKEPLISLIEKDELSICIPGLDKRTWKEEWQEFFHEAKRFNEVKLEQIFGNKDVTIVDLDFIRREDYSKRLLGEFLRRMHPRLAHEIALSGYPTASETIYLNEDLSLHLKELAGIVARSHGIELRDTFKYLDENYSKAWASPYNVKIIYLMTVLRIADYIQIHKERASRLVLQTRRLSSSVSIQEWEKHNAIDFINTETDDPERIYVQASPKTSQIFLELQKLFKSIQYELDVSWAVLGEVYGRHSEFKKLGLKFRRIQSNIDDKAKFQKAVNYIPEKVIFDADPEILKLLIGPLYGEDPKFGMRELLQNSIDATKERVFLEEGKEHFYEPLVQIDLRENVAGEIILTIHDNGVGMNKDTLINYFFRAGASFRKSDFWQKKFGPSSNLKLDRVGRFGVGVLAAYLLGDEITVTTRHLHSKDGLHFDAKLTSRQIELIKTHCEIGTKIQIKLKKDVAELLNKGSVLDWFTWYKLSHPKITYTIEDKFSNLFFFNEVSEYVPLLEEQNTKWRTFETSMFGQVRWTIDKPELREYPFDDNNERNNSLIINGFSIPNGYSILTRKYSWKLPIICVFDRNGTMPLSLNRNYLQNDNLPFEKELLEEIALDVIAKILSLEIHQSGSFYYVKEESRYLKYKEEIDLEPNIIFFGNYFTLDIPFILYKLSIDTLPIIWIKKTQPTVITKIFTKGYISAISDLNSISSYVQKMDDQSFSNKYVRWFSVLGLSAQRAMTWKRIFLKTEKYKYLTVGKRIRLGFKSNSKIESTSKFWTGLIYEEQHSYFKAKIKPSEKFNITPSTFALNDLDPFQEEIDLIVENKFGYYEDVDDYDYSSATPKVEVEKEFNKQHISQFEIFENMLTQYLGADYLIPVNFEERKTKFTKAFSVLGEKIRFHRENSRK